MRSGLLTLLAIMIACAAATAQYTSTKGRFEVDQVKGCAPLTVNVTIIPPSVCTGSSPCDMDYESTGNPQNLLFTYTYTQPGTYNLTIYFQMYAIADDDITITVDPDIQPAAQIFSCNGNSTSLIISDTNYDEYAINYNDGSPEVVVPRGPSARDNHTFATAGNKLVSVRGRNSGADDNCSPRNLSVNAVATLPTPTISQLQVLDAASLRLDFTNVQGNIYYKLEAAINAGSWQPYRDVYNSSTETISGLNTASNYYRFRLGVFDPCSNSILGYSNEISSADFDVTAVNNANRLIWRTGTTGVSNYNFSRTPAATVPITSAPPQTTLDDTAINCNVEYCYQMTTVYANGSRSISLPMCVTAFSDAAPLAPQNISTQITETTTLDLFWSQDPAYTPAEYTIFKAGVKYGQSTQPNFTDNAFLLNANECYAISYVDACGNQSVVSATACHLQVSAVLQDDNSVALSWNAYNGWINGVANYTVERYDSDGQLLSSTDAGTALTYIDTQNDPDHQQIGYRIVAYAVDGTVIESISNVAVILKQPNIYYPNTFTPNGDGLNDTFQVKGQYMSEVEFMVFNRWGEMLFYTTDLSVAWDGNYRGSTVPEGTYVFRCFLTDMSGTKHERSGNVVVLRKH